MARYLIVGGPDDGTWVEVDAGRRYVELAVRKALPMTAVSAAAPAAMETLEVARYTRRSWHSQGTDWLLYAPPDLTDADVFERLLRGYRSQRLTDAEKFRDQLRGGP